MLERPLLRKFPGLGPGAWRRLGVLLAAAVLVLCSCGQVRPLPPHFQPQDYQSITYQELLSPGQAGLGAGQKVRVPAFFWQFLTYDPATVRNYLSLARHPLSWHKLQWFALYGSEDMKGYYDLAAMDPAQKSRYRFKRLDPVTIYGELSSLGMGFYLRVHHLETLAPE